MGCGASKSLKVEPSEDNGSETAATVVSPVYKAPVEKEETIIKILLSTDFDPLSLHNLNSSGGIENWTLAISFKVLCLPSQVVNVFQIISKR